MTLWRLRGRQAKRSHDCPIPARAGEGSLLRPLSIAAAHLIVLRPYLSAPLTAHPAKSRFCDGRTYAVLYAAGDFATAFAEVVVRELGREIEL
jgi:hypothetical protein